MVRLREKYANTLEDGLYVDECGLHVSTSSGYLGTYPDGLVYKAGEVSGCIEIKCPYSAREKLVRDACTSQFFCSKDENNSVLEEVSQLLLPNPRSTCNTEPKMVRFCGLDNCRLTCRTCES